MADQEAMKGRIKAAFRGLWASWRDVLQHRKDIITMGNGTYTARVLDGDPDPVPDLDNATMSAAMQALQATDNAIAATVVQILTVNH